MNLKKIRDKEKFYEKISTKSESTINNTKRAIKLFDDFLMTMPDAGTKSADDIHEEVIAELNKMDTDECIDTGSDLLQDWIHYMGKNNLGPQSVRIYFSTLNRYFHYRGIRFTPQDVSSNIVFPAKIKEEKHPLAVHEIRKILDVAMWKKKGLYLTLASSGMRIGEAVLLRKRDFDMQLSRIRCRIPAKITKTNTGRTTFISKEAASFVIPRLKRINDDDRVFGTHENGKFSAISENQALAKYVKRTGLDEKYTTGFNKITLHSFRAFFFTRAARTHDENYAHMMIGHGGYLLQYDRLTDEEKLDMYVTMEPELMILDQNRNEKKIEKLQEQNSKLADEKDRELHDQKMLIRQLETRLRKMEENMIYPTK